jgi:hypothetical protein
MSKTTASLCFFGTRAVPTSAPRRGAVILLRSRRETADRSGRPWCLSPDAKRVTLKLNDLRPGFLYEFQLKPLVRGKELFHPAEAHYTLNQIP